MPTPGRVAGEPYTSVRLTDGTQVDAAGLLRISLPTTIFDSHQDLDNQPLLFDDAEVSGSGTSSTHSTDRASTTISVSNATAGKRVRQSLQRMPYLPSRSQLILETAVMGAGAAGISVRWGYFDENNGLLLQSVDGVVSFVRRTSTSGSPVDVAYPQSGWNLDRLDGSCGRYNPSGIRVDWSKSQLLVVDFRWLGVGRIRFGLVIGNTLIYTHEYSASNVDSVVWMSSPSQPIRYEIENDGTGPAYSFEFMCCSVISEGGYEPKLIPVRQSTGTILVGAASTANIYAVVGVRLATVGASALVRRISMLITSNADFEWILYDRPTLSSPLSYSTIGSTHIQGAIGTGQTITAGHEIDGGFGNKSDQQDHIVPSQLQLGHTIAGVATEQVLAVRGYVATINVRGSISIDEYN